MTNHYHLVASTPDLNLDSALQYFQSKVTQRVAAASESNLNAFHTRYRWSLICERGHYLKVYRYVYQNPLRAGICSNISEYPYSTIHGKLGYSKLEIPLYNHDLYSASSFDELQDEEMWLNEFIEQRELQKIKQGIRRSRFKLGSGRG